LEKNNYFEIFRNLIFVMYFSGCDSAGDAVLDAGGHPEAGEAGDGAVVCAARVLHHGEEPEVGRKCQNVGPHGRGGGEEARAERQTRRCAHSRFNLYQPLWHTD